MRRFTAKPAQQTWINAKRLLCCLSALVCALLSNSARGTEDAGSSQIRVVNYVTCWSLDSEGYHPAILLKIENNSKNDLTGQEIRFQGRFMDLRTTSVTVARGEQRAGFRPRQRMVVWLKGPEAYELSISSKDWPIMECKVMCRIGDVSDDETQILVITEVDRLAMSDEDAKDQLEKLHEYSQTPPQEDFQSTHLLRSNSPCSTRTASIAQSHKPSVKTKKPKYCKRNAT